jgi:hypothetical protein
MASLLSRQFGVLSRRQAESLGLSTAALRYRSQPGRSWQQILPGVYLTVTGTPTADQLDMAALLYAGNCSVITGLSALRRYDVAMGRSATNTVDVLVPATCSRVSRSYVRLHRTRRLPSRAAADQAIRFAMVARAVTDAALMTSELRDMRAIVAAGIQRGRCTPGEIAVELGESRLANSRMLRSVLAEVTAGIMSPAEGDLMDLIRTFRLPEPLYNPRLYADTEYLGRPDAWWEAVGVAAEVDSREYHFYQEDWERTMSRHDRLEAAGIRVLHITPRQIRARPEWVAGLIRRALSTGSPVPGLRTVPAAR